MSAQDHLHPRQFSPLDLDSADRLLHETFHPQQLDAPTVPHPKTGYAIKAGRELRLHRPEPDAEGPAQFNVREYGDPREVGYNSLSNMLGKEAGTEPVRHVYRGMSTDEWHEASKRGYIKSDQRGTIADWEGTNAGTDPRTALSYLPHSGEGVIAKIRVEPQDQWFTRREDSYLRTRQPVPLDRVERVSPVIAKDERGRTYVRQHQADREAG